MKAVEWVPLSMPPPNPDACEHEWSEWYERGALDVRQCMRYCGSYDLVMRADAK